MVRQVPAQAWCSQQRPSRGGCPQASRIEGQGAGLPGEEEEERRQGGHRALMRSQGLEKFSGWHQTCQGCVTSSPPPARHSGDPSQIAGRGPASCHHRPAPPEPRWQAGSKTGVLLVPDGAPAPGVQRRQSTPSPRLPPSPPAAPGHLLHSPLPAALPTAAATRPGPSRLGAGACRGEGSRGTMPLVTSVGVRLFYFCVFLPPLPLSCRVVPCSSAPSCTCHLPALQPADERSWVYSPLHYSTQAHPASDGESDTVSAPTAHQSGPADARGQQGSQCLGGRAGPGSPCKVARGAPSGLCPALRALRLPGPGR